MRPDLRDLLSDPMFSDLTLVCESERFKVHRNIVCSQSPVLKAACTGQFQVRFRYSKALKPTPALFFREVFHY